MIERQKLKARAAGRCNLVPPDSSHGSGLTFVQKFSARRYAYVAAPMEAAAPTIPIT
jgi:hypothetical protein